MQANAHEVPYRRDSIVLTVRSNGTVLACALAATGVVAMAMSPQAQASDHIDSPQLAHDHASDINDVWAFLDPNDNSKVVLIFSTNPFILSSEIIGQSIFDHNLRYRFEIENTGDAVPDRFIDVTYTRGVGRTEPQTATISLDPGGAGPSRGIGTVLAPSDPRIRSFKAQTTPGDQGDTPPTPVITTDPGTGITFFAGAVDDPFFLDNTAANRFVLSSIANPGSPDRSVFDQRIGDDGVGRDTYAGFNTLVAVLSVPVDLLRGTGNKIGINGVTQRTVDPARPEQWPGRRPREEILEPGPPGRAAGQQRLDPLRAQGRIQQREHRR